jgi:aspartate/methionine/tyrosine aminotransferase
MRTARRLQDLAQSDIRRMTRESERVQGICDLPTPQLVREGAIQAGLARVAEERDLLVITDEIDEYIRYDGREHISPASLPALRERTVSIMGLSKTFSITGWRLGYAVAPEPLTKATSLGKATSREAAMDVLERTRVASIPGSAFYRGETGEKLLRFCFAKEDDVLDEACRRLRALR